ncbi:MAG: PD-(D/E)XK nuclease family protein [Planctomycetota bacterium]|nr:PD-(D/E)XK nuclease family protein [Planctomycetota bacterium]
MTGRPERHFLGWSTPPLHAAAEWILAHRGEDLADHVIALPGMRAARRLREHLARRARPDWTPPRILTQGRLSDELVRLERPAAGRLARTLAWKQALDDLPATVLESVAHRSGSDPGDRLRLAETVRALHGLLAPEGLDFATLAAGEKDRQSPGESARWMALARVQDRYRAILAEAGLEDPHEGRLAAIDAGEVEPDCRVVLVGVADMNHLLVRLLERIGNRVTALVVACEDLADGFDELGRLDVAFWKDRDVPLAAEKWKVVEKPVDQAEATGSIIAGWNGRYAPEEITIGLADDQIAPYLERVFANAGVGMTNAAGIPVPRTRPYRLLREVAGHLEQKSFTGLAALARDPDLGPGLLDRADSAATLDDYHRHHLPSVADGTWAEDPDRTPAVAALHGSLLRKLGQLADGEKRPLSAWVTPLSAFLERVYGGAPLDPDVEDQRVLIGAVARIAAALRELGELPAGIGAEDVAASEAIGLVLRSLRGETIAPRTSPPDEPTIELYGWLELPLDDAPALIVTGFNEGRVPQSIHGDAFVPDSVRRRLGLPDNDARLARDVYATTVLIETRAEAVFMTGRRTVDNDPLVPSRIAFHVAPDRIADRVRHFLPEENERRPTLAGVSDEPRFVPPTLPTQPIVESMSVSSFKRYLESPYDFYLQRALRLKTLDDRQRELDPMSFGSLAHDVLEEFGRSMVKDSADEKTVSDCLVSCLNELVKERFGDSALPAVFLQVRQLELRLRMFAARQAERAREGWEIRHAEWRPEGGSVPFDVDGEPMALTGRIDRIDFHPEHGWAILDYKTGNVVKAPEAAHRRRDGEWVDLQLPLYVHLARPLGIEGIPHLGYGALGKEEEDIGFKLAETWTENDIESALERARQVVRSVREGNFQQLGKEPYDDIFQAIRGQGMIAGGALESVS